MGRLRISLSALLCACALWQGAAAQLAIDVTVTGVDERGLEEKIRGVSTVAQAPKDTYRALAPLRRAVDSDVVAIRRALASLGYYAAEVMPDVARDDSAVSVVFSVKPGPKFEITDYRIDYADEVEAERPQTLAAAGLDPAGDPTGEALQRLENGLLSYLWSEGFPDAATRGRRVEANFETGEAVAVFPVSTGPKSYFNGIRVTGIERTEEAYIAQLRPFEHGELYQRSDVEEYRRRLRATGLFRDVSISRGERGPDGEVELVIDVEERKRRTLKAGVGYGTDIGPGVNLAWENRNILGRGESLSVDVFAAQPEQTLEAVFTKPRPRLPGTYNLSLLLENQTTDAFEARTVSVGGSVVKEWLEGDLTTSLGARGQFSDIVDLASEGALPEETDGPAPAPAVQPIDNFSAITIPISAIYDTSESELNPTTGVRLLASAENFFVFDGPNFNKVQLGAASRYGFGKEDKTFIAGRFLLGATYGASRAQVPPTERYFAGGGGSIRGYGFQEAGPLNVVEGEGGELFLRDGTPLFDELGNQRVEVGSIGGVSLAEGNIELRRLVAENIQVAVFADAGTVFSSETPDFSGEFFVGVGAGVRYLSPIGPIRVDVALPLERRVLEQRVPAFDGDGNPRFNEDGERIINTITAFEDDIVGIYIALGQPF